MNKNYRDAVWSLIGMANRMQVKNAYADAQTSPFIRSLLVTLFDIDNIISDDLPDKYIPIKEYTLDRLHVNAVNCGDKGIVDVIQYLKDCARIDQTSIDGPSKELPVYNKELSVYNKEFPVYSI